MNLVRGNCLAVWVLVVCEGEHICLYCFLRGTPPHVTNIMPKMALSNCKVLKSWWQSARAIAGLFKYPIGRLVNVY